MNRPIALALVALCALVAPPAVAGPPDPAPSTIPQNVTLVGRDASGQADPIGFATVVIRDLANNPVPGVDVLIDFSTTPDMRLAAAQPDPAIVSVNCSSGPVLRVVTDANGSVTFRIVGQAVGNPSTPSNSSTLRFYSQGIYLGSAFLHAFDLDGGGVGASDLSAWLNDFFSGNSWARSDYNGSLIVDPGDLSVWLKAFFGSNSIQSGGALCP